MLRFSLSFRHLRTVSIIVFNLSRTTWWETINYGQGYETRRRGPSASIAATDADESAPWVLGTSRDVDVTSHSLLTHMWRQPKRGGNLSASFTFMLFLLATIPKPHRNYAFFSTNSSCTAFNLKQTTQYTIKTTLRARAQTNWRDSSKKKQTKWTSSHEHLLYESTPTSNDENLR